MIKDNLRDDIPNFKTGDTLSINVNVREGTKVRQQLFKGTVIARKGSGIAETITIRKMSDGIGVERIFPLHSPVIASIKVDRVNKVRRAKLYYLRGLSGKAARLAEFSSALALRSATSMFPFSSHFTMITFCPAIIALAGLVPCADEGIKVTSR